MKVLFGISICWRSDIEAAKLAEAIYIGISSRTSTRMGCFFLCGERHLCRLFSSIGSARRRSNATWVLSLYCVQGHWDNVWTQWNLAKFLKAVCRLAGLSTPLSARFISVLLQVRRASTLHIVAGMLWLKKIWHQSTLQPRFIDLMYGILNFVFSSLINMYLSARNIRTHLMPAELLYTAR